MRAPKKKVVGFQVHLEVDGQSFDFRVYKRDELKELLDKNRLRGCKVSHQEIYETIK